MAIDRIAVPREARGVRLDKFIAGAQQGLTLDRARVLAGSGKLRIDGKVCRADRRLWGGETVEIYWPKPAKTGGVDGPPVPILYADDDIVIVDKPAGLVVERDAARPSVVALLASRLEGFDVDGRAEPGVVHRLDRDTSGCLLLAKHDKAVAALKDLFEAKKIEKRYWALVLGDPPDQARLETAYGRDKEDARRFTTRISSPRRAALSFTLHERFPGAAWLDVSLETGRTHQIRVQLADAGWSVLGDSTYGLASVREHPAAIELGRHALHSCRMALPQPTTGLPVSVEAPMPEGLERAVARLRLGS